MRICGVELTGSDAVVCLLNLENQQFNIPDCRVRKLSIPKEHNQYDIKQFQAAFAQLMKDYKVDKVAIKGRLPKGKFAGGAVSFKLEACIQLIADIDVIVITSSQAKAVLGENPLQIPFADTELKGFQEAAFVTAYIALQATV
ncbi:DUF3010 family protein [Zhongshania arctica]|uniref:DUF3010 family protein n=1 Tax=Zhongshania arctica TaxID=3238302 RepID=A0ABV3TU44_9GAMM|tara:strand:+ start:978 stop:1406 length:429 start_codon:yes stop_codon:yes gene_type:complete